MPSRTANLALLFSVLASIVLHAVLLLPLVVDLASADPDRSPSLREARFDREAIEPHEPEFVLGIEKSPHSTLTWIGYEEYEEHLARLSEIEQAAQTTEAEAIAGASSLEAPTPVEVQPEFPDALPEPMPQPMPDPATRPMQVESLAEAIDLSRAAGALEQAGQWLRQRERAVFQRVRDAVNGGFTQWSEIVAAAEELELPAPADSTEPTDSTDPADDSQIDQTSDDRPDSGGQGPADDGDGSDDVDRTGEPGDAADRDSPPTSTIEVPRDAWQQGSPIAVEGLEILTRRPRFTNLERLGRWPRNPVCELHFDRDGVPRRVRVISSSGYRDLDEAIVTSMYQWRARGRQLEQLGEDQTIPVRIHLILTSRR